MKHYGLIGYPLLQSYSPGYFNEKFSREAIAAKYSLFPMEDVSMLRDHIQSDPLLEGLNVTIPHKESVIPLLDELDPTAAAIQAVNVIRVERKENQIRLIGYNSDLIGFRESIRPLLRPKDKKALVLGSGGAAKAIVHGLRELGIEVKIVSRKAEGINTLSYQDLNESVIKTHTIIVNASPVGMYPNIDQSPDIPYMHLSADHLLYDAVYKPEETLFLRKGKLQGCRTINGLEMLYGQAQAAWEIWNR